MTKNHNVAAMLAARFPQTFVADSSRPHRPLKLGIDRDLVALGVLDEASATRTLRHYCSRLMYRRSLVPGAVRVDLDGQAAGEVATAHAAHAQRIVTRMEASSPVHLVPTEPYASLFIPPMCCSRLKPT
jgi:ProP effector